jgi:hypothetical protein
MRWRVGVRSAVIVIILGVLVSRAGTWFTKLRPRPEPHLAPEAPRSLVPRLSRNEPRALCAAQNEGLGAVQRFETGSKHAREAPWSS